MPLKRKMYAGSTSQPLPIFLYDSTKTDGSGLGSLVYNSSGLVAEYRREGQSSYTAITLVAGTLGTWSSGGFIADGSIAGAYELGLPDAALASGVSWVVVQVRGATNQVAYRCEIELDAVNYQSASGFISGVNALAPPSNWDVMAIDGSGRIDLGKIKGTASAGAAGYVGIDWGNVNAPTTTVNLSGTTISTSQAIASVSGAVGSVTGDVGGNVDGYVSFVNGGVNGSVLSVTGSVGSISGVTFPAGFSSLTAGAIATAVLTDTGDNTTTGSPGKILAQLAGAFTGTTSVYTAAALANAPSGGGSFPTNFSVLSIDSSGRVDVGKRLGRDLSLPDGTLAAATSSTITLPANDADTNPVPTDGRLVGKRLVIRTSTGVGQEANLVSWAGAGTAGGLQYGVSPSFVATPDATSEYLWIPGGGGSGAGSDPWSTSLPGGYGAGTAGYILGQNLDAAVSSRSTYAGGAVASVTGNVGGNVAGSVGSISGVTFPANFGALVIDAGTGYVFADVRAIAGVAYHDYFASLTDNCTSSVIEFAGTDSADAPIVAGSLANQQFLIAQGAGTGQALVLGSWISGQQYNLVSGASPTVPDHTSRVNYSDGASPAGGAGSYPTNFAALKIATTGEVAIDLTQIKQATAPTTLSNITVPTVSSVTSASLNLAQSVPVTNTAQTVGDALNAARADGFGNWVLSGTTLTIYAADGTTAVRTFTLDSGTAPTQRS